MEIAQKQQLLLEELQPEQSKAPTKNDIKALIEKCALAR